MTTAELLWVMAMLAGTGVAVLLAQRANLDASVAYWAAVVALICGELGGLLLGFYDYGLPGGLFNPLSRGKSFLGGLIGGALAAVAYLRLRRVPVSLYGDVLVTALALGYAVGRIGCFFNGCDYGLTTSLPWGHSYPPGTEAYEAHLERGWITQQAVSSLPVHPVQLYASAAGLLIFLVLLRCRTSWPGQRIWLFALMYGGYRFCIEWLRGDFRAFLGPFSLPQVAGMLLITGALGFSYRHRCRNAELVPRTGTGLMNGGARSPSGPQLFCAQGDGRLGEPSLPTGHL